MFYVQWKDFLKESVLFLNAIITDFVADLGLLNAKNDFSNLFLPFLVCFLPEQMLDHRLCDLTSAISNPIMKRSRLLSSQVASKLMLAAFHIYSEIRIVT